MNRHEDTTALLNPQHLNETASGAPNLLQAAPAVRRLSNSILESVNKIGIERLDACVLANAMADLFQEFEYRECDKANIDALYTFCRLLGRCIDKIAEANTEIEVLARTAGGAA